MLEDQDLIPLCAAQFTRRACDIQLAGGTVCELCGDVGQLAGGGSEEDLCEIEVELKSGSEEILEAYAEELMDHFDLQEEPRSKFGRASLLARH